MTQVRFRIPFLRVLRIRREGLKREFGKSPTCEEGGEEAVFIVGGGEVIVVREV